MMGDLFPSWLSTTQHEPYVPHPEPPQSIAPLVLVEGFLSYTSEVFWGDFESHLNAHRASVGSKKRRHIIFARVGPANSVHDRACELYYSLKGGTVDYGESHAREHGHSQYGRNHAVGLYPSWSVEHPLHLLGHSIGGVTVVRMLLLIKAGFFPGAHPDMVASVTTVASPHRGTPLGYCITGAYETGPKFASLAISTFLSKYLHLVSYFSPVLPSFLVPDLHNESRKLTMRDMSFFALLRQLWSSDWSESTDATPYDCTFAAGEVRDADFDRFRKSEGGMGARTWYRSYTATITERGDSSGPYHTPSTTHLLKSTPLIYWAANIVGSFDYTLIKPFPLFFVKAWKSSLSSSSSKGKEKKTADMLAGEGWFENDGVVPVASQWHPMECDPSYCTHHPTLISTARPPTSVDSTPHDLSCLSPPPLSSPEPLDISSLTSSLRPFATSPETSLPLPSPCRSHSPSSSSCSTAPSTPPTLSSFSSFSSSSSSSSSSSPSSTLPFPPTRRHLPSPGKWDVITVRGAHHLSLMPYWMESVLQRSFWFGMGEFLEMVDEGRTVMN